LLFKVTSGCANKIRCVEKNQILIMLFKHEIKGNINIKIGCTISPLQEQQKA